MNMHMDLGLCYRMVFADGSSMQLRYLGTDAEGQTLVETPPGSRKQEILTRNDVVDFYQIDVPSEEMERSVV